MHQRPTGAPPAPRATLALVARSAGVSVASASRVLNGLSATPAMADRVHSAAEKLGYAPNALARSLKARRSEQLAFVVADVGNPVYVAMMRAVDGVVRAAGYRLVISSTGSAPAEEASIVQNLSNGWADGLVLSPLRFSDELVDQLRCSRVPTVVVGSPPPGLEVDTVRADSPRGVGLALRHLLDAGARRTAFVNGPADTVPGTARADGFTRGVKRLGLVDDPTLRVEAADFTFAAGLVAARELLDRMVPEAVVAANDLLAVAAMHILAERGLRVPDDVMVVGMDDTDLAAMAAPSLTSVGLGSAERGRLAGQMLLDRIADPTLPARSARVAPRLVVRASTTGARP